MSSEIQFGEVEQNEPQKAVRPDRDAHYCIAAVGDIDPNDLPIYVDLDVQRDMEAHAHANTRVELGGVMLGKQCIDAEGKPFVVVTDSLRARHYEATRGSFKFTHETWSQITGERNQFHPDLEMVGWYHTHPGWTVFLSPMDLFICNNFFNRELDVALVIDPCNDDRGWFQWDASHQTQRTGGFFLMSIRYREQELNHFASIYNHEPPMNSDPRYSGYHITGSSTQGTAMDSRKPWFDLLMVSMLLTQLFFMAFMIVRLGGGAADAEKVAAKEDPQVEMAATSSLENRSLKMALSALARSTGQEQIADRMVNMETDRQQLAASLEGQLARVELLSLEKAEISAENAAQEKQVKKLAEEVTLLREKISLMKKSTEGEEPLLEEGESKPAVFSFYSVLGTGIFGLLLGGGMMFLLGRGKEEENYEQQPTAVNFETSSEPEG